MSIKINGGSTNFASTFTASPTAERTITIPDASFTMAGSGISTTYSAPQSGAITTDNDGSFDLSVTNNFKCTPTGIFTLTFINHTAGQSGYVILDNSGGYAVSAAATTKLGAATLATISTAGVYLLSYLDDGTNAYVTASGALA